MIVHDFVDAFVLYNSRNKLSLVLDITTWGIGINYEGFSFSAGRWD